MELDAEERLHLGAAKDIAHGLPDLAARAKLVLAPVRLSSLFADL